MPLQNRVLPNGDIIAATARGTLMGNRGLLHNDHKEVVRPFRLKAWITCALEFKGRKRQLMSPGMYTELFFLDEVTALAAGHRPCAECRRQRFNEFKQAWQVAHPQLADGKLKVAEIDAVLHEQRLSPDGSRPLWQASLAELPIGTMIERDGGYYAVHASGLLPWHVDGYGQPLAGATEGQVMVVTPRATVAVLAAGYEPAFHESANSDQRARNGPEARLKAGS